MAYGFNDDRSKNDLSGKADAEHTHDASDITSGTLPIEHGGTGAATAEEARTALGLDVIGSRYAANSTINIGSGGIDSPVTGASVTVPAGTYVVNASCTFSASSSSDSRNIQTAIYEGASTRHGTQRILCAGPNYAILQATDILVLTEDTTLSVRPSASMAASGCATWINAVRIA